MKPVLLMLAVAVTAAAACSTPPSGPMKLADMPPIDTNAVLADIRKLSSDEFEGRSPGSKGEELTVAYLTEQFKKLGLKPGNPDGTYVQNVPLVGFTSHPAMTVTAGGETKTYTPLK